MKTFFKLLFALLGGAFIGFASVSAVIMLVDGVSLSEYLSVFGRTGARDVVASVLTAIVSFIVSVVVLVIVHEAGHLVCGLLSGYRFVSFRIFNLTVIKAGGRLRLRRFAVAGTGGQCLLVPPDKDPADIPTDLYNAGGVLANILALLPGIALLCFCGNPFVWEAAWIYILIDIVLIALNGIPMKAGGIGNDAYNMFYLRRHPEAKGALAAQLRINALVQEGLRPAEMPDELFVIPDSIDYGNHFDTGTALMEASRMIDRFEWENARIRLEEIYSCRESIIGLYVMETAVELMFVSLVTGHVGRGVELYDDRMKKYVAAYAKVMSSKKRALFAVALYIEKDRGRAVEIYEKLRADSGKYLMQGEVRSDLAIMKSLLEEAGV